MKQAHLLPLHQLCAAQIDAVLILLLKQPSLHALVRPLWASHHLSEQTSDSSAWTT